MEFETVRRHAACNGAGARLFLASVAWAHRPAGNLTEDPLLQPSPVPATSFVERLRTGAGRRSLAIGLALLIEAVLLLLLLSLGAVERPGEEDRAITVVNLEADAGEEKAAPDSPKSEPPAKERPTPQRPAMEQPRPLQSAEPVAAPTPPLVTPPPSPLPSSVAPPPVPARPAPSGGAVYGPPNRGGSSSSRDTERVGTAPNGEPLYAAAWYREPRPDELSGYLSTVSGPAWGLIACRTAPDYRVEDCVGLSEYPQGSQMNRAVLAAAWQFKVRPPQLGGRPQIGSWVRIKIDYGIQRRRRVQ